MHSRRTVDVTADDSIIRKKATAVVDAVFNKNSSRSPNRKSSDGKRRGTMGSDEQTIGIPTEYGGGNYYTVSGADAGYLKDSISKNYHLQPVRESERHPATMSTSLTSSVGPQKKHGLFSKKDPKRETSPTPAGAPPPQLRNTPSPHSRHHSGPNSKQHSGGKVKHFIDSFRHKTKSNACDCPEISSVSSAEAHHCCETGESRFTVTAAGTVAESSPRHLHPNPNQHFHHPAVRQMSTLSPSLEIGPDQYLEMHHRHRTQSDTTKLLLARKQARDRFNHIRSSISGGRGEEDDDGEMHYLVWRDKVKGTKVFRMPSATHEYEDDDAFCPPSASYARFLRDHTCYDLMPPSSKIVVFDMRLSVKRSFLALVGNGVKAAVLWDTELQDFTSMLTITDFIKILYRYHRAGEIGVEDVENDTICKWKSVFNSSNLISCCPEDSLFTALKLLCQNRVHRLLVIDSKLGNPINILTHKRILKFIHLHMKTIPEPDFMNSSISSIQTATTKNVSTITYSTRLINVLRLFIEHHISAVPVVDERGKLIDVFAKFDFSKLAYDKLYSDLGRPVREIMSKQKSENSMNMHTCKLTDTLKTVVDRIVTASVHRLIIVNDDEEVVGVLTLSDLLRHLVLDPIENHPTNKHPMNEEKLKKLMLTGTSSDDNDHHHHHHHLLHPHHHRHGDGNDDEDDDDEEFHSVFEDGCGEKCDCLGDTHGDDKSSSSNARNEGVKNDARTGDDIGDSVDDLLDGGGGCGGLCGSGSDGGSGSGGAGVGGKF